MDIRRLVGRNVRRIRLEKRLSQEQFAERAGFTQQYLSDLERGLRNPTVMTLYELARALEVEHVALVAPDDEALTEEVQRRNSDHESAASERNRKTSRPVARKSKKPTRRGT
jgi:transcriptional regulator with XRE-family HTH domain